MRIIWSPLSLQQISEIARYIALDKQGAAEKWVDSLFEFVESLDENPEQGRMVPEIQRSEIRELIFRKSFRVVYRIEGKKIEILIVKRFVQLLRENEIES